MCNILKLLPPDYWVYLQIVSLLLRPSMLNMTMDSEKYVSIKSILKKVF